MSDAHDNFLWGATVCAHAVEGADFNADWWRWEQRPGHVRDGTTSETAAGHYDHFKADVKLAAKFGLNALQYGVSWARVEPERGVFDDEALAHYAHVFSAMARNHITPVCVLHEHALPQWFCECGGWENDDAPEIFSNYAARLHEAIGAHCSLWIPHMEPLLGLSMAYGEHRWPAPEGRRTQRAAMRGIAHAHREVRDMLKELNPKNRVGLSLYVPHLFPLDPYSPWDYRVADRAMDWLFDALPGQLKANEAPACFLSVTAPGTLGVHLAPWRFRNGFLQFEDPTGRPCPLDSATPDVGVLGEVLQRANAWDLPVLVTDAGVATDDDRARCHHVLDLAEAVLALREAGVPVMGLFFRSFLDGFHWDRGLQHRTGLVHVDWTTLTRTPNPSAFLYQDIAKHGAIRPGAVSRFAPDWTAGQRVANL